MKLSEELVARGLVHQISSESLAEIIDGAPRTVYHGIDPSADSAHAGNFVNWILLRHLVDRGHKVIFLVGGGTGLIGDPKPDAERTLASVEEIEGRVAKLQVQAQRLLGAEVIFVNNIEWLGSLGLIPFLRDIGKHFTVNELIKKDAISTRLQSQVGLSYTEFAYPLLQAYDYLQLHEMYGCDLQIGGSDQWGNIVAGVELVRKKKQATVYAMTVPLIIDKATGKKFGKSEGNAVWLDPEKTSPYAFYQFWYNTPDESVIDFLKTFTLLPLEQIHKVRDEFEGNPGARSAQKILAFSVTKLVHGEATATAVAKVSEVLFGEVLPGELSAEEVVLLREVAPLTSVKEGTPITEALVAGELATSKREARTFIESGAVEINGTKITDTNTVFETSVFGTLALMKRGKKQRSLIEGVQ